ncbi:MAG: type II secretion system protein, partial [Planctomycetes bacterium]|nr:type II secretion system protein [Planctomycetota bacterium]
MKSTVFTMVELLMVAAILAILVGLLFPVLVKSVEAALRLSCLNDRRQNGIQITCFSEDHGGLVPHATAQEDANRFRG